MKVVPHSTWQYNTMGNNSSKHKSSSLRPGNYPPFQRSDTSNSVKSSRSLRSRRSIGRDSDTSSFKTAHSVYNDSTSPILSRKNSSAKIEQNEEVMSQHMSELDMNVTPNGSAQLPPSMVQLQPKEPILMRRESGTDENRDPGNSSSLSKTTFLTTPSSPISMKHHRGSDVTDEIAPQLVTARGAELNLEEVIQKLLDAGYSGKRTKNLCLKNSEIAIICSTARETFLSQPPLLELSAPVKIVGDVHGQYSDLIRIFTKCGFPPAANYLFLGDYVDRGKQSLETILLLLCYKIKYPENFFLLRGNHECANVTRVYGFYDECKRRSNLKTWKLFIDTFNTLPITAVVASKIFCVHGGLSPVLNSMEEIKKIQRPTDVPDYGLLNDLLWSDPADTVNEWEDNERGVSYCFNKIAINKFLNKFNFDLVVRAHMVVEDGYEFFNDRSLVTVFSAPNYCGEFDNWGAVMSVSEELLCSFELLDPLDSVALKQVMKKGKYERRYASLQNSENEYHQSV